MKPNPDRLAELAASLAAPSLAYILEAVLTGRIPHEKLKESQEMICNLAMTTAARLLEKAEELKGL